MKTMNKLTILAFVAMMTALALLAGSAAADILEVGPGKTYATIQAAVDAAIPGDTVIVFPGTYNEQVNVDKDLTVQGLGFPTVNGAPSAFWITAVGAIVEKFDARGTKEIRGSVIWVQANDVTVRHNKITGEGPGGLLDTAGIFVIGPDFNRHLVPGYTAAWPTIELTGITIEHNSITGTTEPAITFNRVADSRIAGNHVYDVTGDGIQILSTRLMPSYDNTIERNTIGKVGGHGIKLVNSIDNEVRRNRVIGSSFDGIRAQDFYCSQLGGTPPCTHDNMFDRNVLERNGGYDAHDMTTGSGTAGTANTWTDNVCRTDSPDGLCK